jgi:hypothetical protein
VGAPRPARRPRETLLVWPDKQRILFSEIKNGDIHMALVTAEESRAGARDVYVLRAIAIWRTDHTHRPMASGPLRWK